MLIEELLEEIKELAMSDVTPPIDQATDEEREVGLANDDAKKVYGLAMKYDRKSMEYLIEARYGANDTQRQAWSAMAEEAAAKRGALLELFWIILRRDHNLWGGGSIGIRKGWTVVKRSTDDSGPPDFLKWLKGQIS